jgi:hypothetical protein
VTLQERLDAKKAEFATANEQYAKVRATGLELEQSMVRLDGQMKLLEELIKEQAGTDG